jgi:hypothetical protein
MFRGRLRVGDRTMRMGFMAGALPLRGLRISSTEQKAYAGDHIPRAVFIISASWLDRARKPSKGNLAANPHRVAAKLEKCNFWAKFRVKI